MKKSFLYASSVLVLLIALHSCQQKRNQENKQVVKKEKDFQTATNLSNSTSNTNSKQQPNSNQQISSIVQKVNKKEKNTSFFKDKEEKESKGELESEEENEMYDGPDKREEFEYDRIKDPATGKVPIEKLLIAKQRTEESKNIILQSASGINALTWTERGPIFDSVGPTNGNGRGGPGGATFPNTYTSGRIRAVLVDASDATGNTVFVGGIDGGLWKCTNFLSSPPNWTAVNDFFSNLAISWLVQDPISPDIMYFGTGEPTGNADRVLGIGVWKSVDHGITWNLLASTSSFTQVFRILIDNSHNVYLATRSQGLQRSNNGGTTWTNITPADQASTIACTDIELSSTGILHASFGYSNASAVYRYTNIPATVTGAGWNSPTIGLPTTGFNRIELATQGDTIYAAPTNTSDNVISTYKSVNGGDIWTKNNTTNYPTGVSNTQGWYNITLAINPVTTSQILVGGLDEYISFDSGKNVSVLTNWVSTPPYVHADHHFTKWMMVGAESRIIIACDGGLFLSRDGGLTFADKNQNLAIKQFYSVAIHPTTTNYFLAGAQDNGVHQFTKPGLASSVEVIGGDGAFVAIDQDQPQYQFGAYVYNQYRKSTNGGVSWSSFNPCASCGFFINPFDYDNNNNKLYAAYNSNTYLRWDDPQTGSTTTSVTIPINNNYASALTISPYTANLLYVGSNFQNGNTEILKVAAANTNTPTSTSIKDAAMPNGTVSCIKTGTSDQNLILCFSNYNITNVWVSSNGGTSWTGIDGNLPNMPVRWVMFYPGDNTKAIIATETGVWETNSINGASTVWVANTSFPNVRTDMLKYRSSDGTIAAATHGRGLWTAIIPVTTTTWTGASSNSWTTAGNWTNGVPDISTHAIIPNVSPNPFPVLNTNQNTNNLSINSSASITVTSPGNLQIAGVFTNNGTISGTGVTTLLSGGLGPVTGTGTVSNLTLNSGALITSGAGNMQSITGVLTVNGLLTTNGNLTLKSTSAGTASIAAITNGSISGNVTVERYTSDKRSWRLLGLPFSASSQTIKAAWQEGATISTQNPNPPYGTHITTFSTDVNLANFDAVKPASSIRIYLGDNFTSDQAHTPNTTTTITSNPAYFLFVRGDRTIDLNNTSAHGSATLRITGTINSGSVTKGTGTSFSLIPNPYPSLIDFDAVKISNPGITTFYVWDATLSGPSGVGQYRTIDVGGFGPNYTYTATPGGGDNKWRFIESGTAFFIQGNNTVNFTEAMKTSSIPPSSMLRTTSGNETELVVNLYTLNTDNTASLIDGIREVYNNTYSATVDNSDAKKITGMDDINLGISNNTDVLAVERRPLPDQNDVVYLKLWNTMAGNYQFEVQPANFPSTTLFAYLRDNYLNTYTPLSLSADTKISFNISSDAASAATNRFSVVFTKSVISPATPLIVVYPNPVQNGLIKLQLNNMPKGIYSVKLVNNLGQTLLRKEINHAEGTSIETISVNKITGSYMLEVNKPDNTKSVNKIIIN